MKEQWLEKNKLERIEWYKKSKEPELSKKKHDKETPETLNTCDLPKNFFETATKENLQTYQRKAKYWKKLRVLMIYHFS